MKSIIHSACFLPLVAAVLLWVAFSSSGGVRASVGFDDCKDCFVESSYVPGQPRRAAQLCRNKKLAISYDINMLNPAWSAYYITHDDVSSLIPGRDDFYEDPDLQALGVTQPPVDSPCYDDPYNKGHLSPSHIMSHTASSKQATYTVANIAPQWGDFNMGPWQRLENAVYHWILANRTSLHIITGVAYDSRSSPRTCSSNSAIAVPDYYFKVICDKKNKKSAGFYGRNVANSGEPMAHFYTVQAVEKLYGGRLFPSTECATDRVDSSYWWGS